MKFIIAGIIPSQKHLWIIGDSFLSKIFHALPALNRQARIDDKKQLFMYQQFNVCCFTTNPTSRVKSTAVKIVNCLIKAMNDQVPKELEEPDKIIDKFLPRIIIVAPDWDVIRYVDHDDYGVDEIFGTIIKLMIETMINEVEKCKEQMLQIKPGAVTPGEPKFIWIKCIRRLGGYDKAMSVCNRFNKLLEHFLAEKKHHYIIDMDPALNDSTYFNKDNELNASGRVKYWQEVNDSIDMFELDKLKLKPAANPEQADNHEQTAQQKRYKLPPILPKQQSQSRSDHRNNGNNNNSRTSHHRRNDKERQDKSKHSHYHY